MSFANVIRLNIYTTDVDEFLANYGSMAERLQSAGVAPPAHFSASHVSPSQTCWSRSKQPPSTDLTRFDHG